MVMLTLWWYCHNRGSTEHYYSDLHFQREDLKELDTKFLMTPAQVMTVEVSGMEEYEDSDSLINMLNHNLLGRPLAAMVENRDSLEEEEIPKLIFFDTSTDDVDININQKLIEFIGEISP